MTIYPDLECPYCEEGLEINHDDGFGYEEGKKHEMQCEHCEKYFVFETSISFNYEPETADCLNGAPHEMVPVSSTARDMYPDWKRCKHCDHEERGRYVEPDWMKETA